MKRVTEPEILVIGAGPAGLSAALAAAQGGAGVTLLDAAAGPGGQLWRGARLGGGGPAAKWLDALAAQPRVSWLTGSQVLWAEPDESSFIWNVSTPQGVRRLRAAAHHSGDRGHRTLLAVSRLDAARRDGGRAAFRP